MTNPDSGRLKRQRPRWRRARAVRVGAARDTADAKVRTLSEFAKLYGLGSPDEIVGTTSTTSFLDYGPPIILADSARPSRKAKADEERWQRILKQA